MSDIQYITLLIEASQYQGVLAAAALAHHGEILHDAGQEAALVADELCDLGLALPLRDTMPRLRAAHHIGPFREWAARVDVRTLDGKSAVTACLVIGIAEALWAEDHQFNILPSIFIASAVVEADLFRLHDWSPGAEDSVSGDLLRRWLDVHFAGTS